MISLESEIRRHAWLAIILTAISVAIGERTSTFKTCFVFMPSACVLSAASTLTFGLRIPGAMESASCRLEIAAGFEEITPLSSI